MLSCNSPRSDLAIVFGGSFAADREGNDGNDDNSVSVNQTLIAAWDSCSRYALSVGISSGFQLGGVDHTVTCDFLIGVAVEGDWKKIINRKIFKDSKLHDLLKCLFKIYIQQTEKHTRESLFMHSCVLVSACMWIG